MPFPLLLATAAVVSVPAGVITITGPVPGVAIGTAVSVPAGLVTLTGPVPSVRVGTTVAVPACVIEFTSSVIVTTSAIAAAAGPVQVVVDGFEIGGERLGWEIEGEELLGGIGPGKLRIIDNHPLTSGFEPTSDMDVRVLLRSTGWPMYHGLTLTPQVDLPPKMTYRIWDIELQDYNAEIPNRLVGAPAGDFWRPDSGSPAMAIDASAISSATDDTTVRDWFAAYFRFPNGASVNTGTYVGNYIDNAFLGAEENIMWLYDATTNLQSVLEALASAAQVNVQGWLMPDDNYAWLEIVRWQDLIVGASQGLLPSAPVALGTGGTEVMSLKISRPGRNRIGQLYVQGATTYTLSSSGTVTSGGSGFYPQNRGNNRLRQAYIAAPGAWTEEQKNRFAESAYQRGQTDLAIVTVTVEGVDEWRAGQVVTLTDDRLPPSLQDGSGTGTFVIQRVYWKLYPGTDVRQYELDLGDGAVSRIAQYASRDWHVYHPDRVSPTGPQAKRIFIELLVDIDTGELKHGQRRQFKAYPRATDAHYWQLAGIPMIFEAHAYDAETEEEVFSPNTDATTNPTSVSSDRDGAGRGYLVADTTRDDLKYKVRAYFTVLAA